MTVSEFKKSLECYKKLKDFLKENFSMEPQDGFDISNGELTLLHWNFGECYPEGITIERILENLEEDISF